MPAPENLFKRRLLAGETLIGCWVALGDAYAAELMGTAGFDWLVIDGEHAPNDIRSIRNQLAVLAASASEPVVRLPVGEPWLIKQALDIGVQTLLIPMVESAAQAKALVRACRYPPNGIRGAGAALGRASQFAAISDYVPTADAQICLLLQVESRAGLDELDEIAGIEGVDGVFIGPSDLTADMGYGGIPDGPEVKAAIADAFRRIAAAGKAPGCLGMSEEATQRYLDQGARFVATGSDVGLLAKSARDLATRWKPNR